MEYDRMRRFARAGAACIAALVAGAAGAGEALTYRVEAGDTLIGLGERLLARPADWRRLQRLNGVADPWHIPTGSILRIPVALLKAEPRRAEVLAVHGAPRVDGRAVQVGEAVAAGARLETREDENVVLGLPDGSRLVLPARSALRVDALNGYAGTPAQAVDLRLEAGRVESRVQPQRGPAARYRVDTPTAVIGVRGTEFRVAVADGAARAEVTEGRVGVRGATGRTVREVPAGFGLVAAADGGLPAAVPLLPAPPVEGLPSLVEEPIVRIALPVLDGARAWRAEIAADRPDAPVLASQRVEIGPLRVPGLPDGTYRLRLRGIDAQGLEGRDAVHAFKLKARPEPPFGGAPTDGGKATAGEVGFTWTAAPEAATYRLQLSAGADFTAPLADVEGLAATEYRARLEPGEYRWRVASVRADGDRGPWTPTARITVRPPPQTPEPPAIGDREIEFRWRGEAGQRFDYQFAADEGFADLRHSGTLDAPALTLARPDGGQYWLRVRAIDPDGFVSPWSGAQRIEVPRQFPWWIIPILTLPLLLP